MSIFTNPNQNSLSTYSINLHLLQFTVSFIHSFNYTMEASIVFLLILLALSPLILLHHATAESDTGGFHGYERDALLSLKQGFNNSFLDGNWTGIMCYMDHVPYWYGIQCLHGRVTGLKLENMWLSGEIKADALFNLTELTDLSFKGNSFTGNLMDFTNNQKLTRIDLSGNGFLGNIPSSLPDLTSLESLQLQGNKLTGPIPAFNQSRLKIFNVSDNNLSGPIPNTTTLLWRNPSSYFGNPDLCGPPSPVVCMSESDLSNKSTNEDSGGKSDGNFLLIALLVVADIIVVVVIMLLFIIFYKKYKKLKKEMEIKNGVSKDEEQDSRILELAKEHRAPEIDRGKLVFMQNEGARFELDDLLKASAEGLGRGNFGNCYKAMLETGQAVVVKRLRDLKPLSSEEFVRQVRAIAEQKHPNLLPLLAYYSSPDEKLFLLPHAANGNIYNRLHGGKGTRERVPFRWSSRLSVARGVGRALEYLHLNTRSQTTVPHGNLKSSNVLLDENEEVRVCDYGLTSLIAIPVAAQRMVTYKCPEYQSHKRISKKSDVWSYGCLLLELLTGRIPAHSAPPGTDAVDLCSWVHRAVREEWTAEIFDAEIAVQRGANQGMLKLMRIAIKCCDKSPEKRPDISQVVVEVEEIKVVASSDEEYSYSSLERSLTDDSVSGPSSLVIIADDRK